MALLVLAGTASASRPASEGELIEFEVAAKDSPEVSQQYPLNLTNARVSTVGPWAIATFNLYLGKGEDDTALGIFRKRESEPWELVRVNSEYCVGPITSALGMPPPVGHDLGLTDCPRPSRQAPTKVLVARGACFPDVFTYRPHSIGISCDRTLSLKGIHWKSYGGRIALGKGTARTQGCTPSCANGPVPLVPVTIRLSKVVTCEGRRLYARMFYRLSGRVPPGFLRHSSLPMLARNEFEEPLC